MLAVPEMDHVFEAIAVGVGRRGEREYVLLNAAALHTTALKKFRRFPSIVVVHNSVGVKTKSINRYSRSRKSEPARDIYTRVSFPENAATFCESVLNSEKNTFVSSIDGRDKDSDSFRAEYRTEIFSCLRVLLSQNRYFQ